MQNAAGYGVAQASLGQDDVYRAVVSDLVSLIEHIQSSLRMIERTIARETSPETSPGNPKSSIVLGDVSPRYMKTAAALQACDVNLGIACDRGLASVMPQAHRRTWWRVLPTCARPSSAPVEAARAFFVSMEIGTEP